MARENPEGHLQLGRITISRITPPPGVGCTYFVFTVTAGCAIVAKNKGGHYND